MLQNKLDIKHNKHILYNNASRHLIVEIYTLKSQHVQHPDASFNRLGFVFQSFALGGRFVFHYGAWCHDEGGKVMASDRRLDYGFAWKLYI